MTPLISQFSLVILIRTTRVKLILFNLLVSVPNTIGVIVNPGVARRATRDGEGPWDSGGVFMQYVVCVWGEEREEL